MSNPIRYVVTFLDGGKPAIETRYFGPFVSFERAYEFMTDLPTPTKGGSRYIHPMQPFTSQEGKMAHDVIVNSRRHRLVA